MNPWIPWDLEDPAWDSTYMTSFYHQCRIYMNEWISKKKLTGRPGGPGGPRGPEAPVIPCDEMKADKYLRIIEMRKLELNSAGQWHGINAQFNRCNLHMKVFLLTEIKNKVQIFWHDRLFWTQRFTILQLTRVRKWSQRVWGLFSGPKIDTFSNHHLKSLSPARLRATAGQKSRFSITAMFI